MTDGSAGADPEATARRHSRRHRDAVLASERCGCFYCLAAFVPGEVEEWVDGGQTALCPRCGVDAVIGSASGHPVTRAFLSRMYERWFAGC